MENKQRVVNELIETAYNCNDIYAADYQKVFESTVSDETKSVDDLTDEINEFFNPKKS